MEFRGACIIVEASIIFFQELIVIVMSIYKIRNASSSVKLKFIKNRYGLQEEKKESP